MFSGNSMEIRKQMACVFLILVGTTLCQPSLGAHQDSPKPVLPLIEKYKAPPYPKDQYLDRETYDYRISSHRPVPDTLTDVLICDVWQRVEMDLKSKITPEEVSEGIIKQALDVYLQKKFEDIAGYRPWTHWNFIRSRTQSQRDTLVTEITEYIKKNGVRDPDEKK